MESQKLKQQENKGAKDLEAAQKKLVEDLVALRKQALLANPLMDFDRLLLVTRGNKSPSLGLPRNWQSNCSLPKSGFDDRIAVLAPVRPEGEISTLYKPQKDVFVGDVDLNFGAERMLFSTVGANGRWQICEILADGSGFRELSGEQPDVDSYDACYLPDGKIAFTSTACFVGVPCVYGSAHVANLYLMNGDGQEIRQLCFDQEHDWCPTVMNNGRLLYSRWEYTDTPHSQTRLLFHMNPDGTEQFEYYGSNSYWPNSIFYARPIPNHPTKVVAVIGGHHDNPRMGEMVIFDPAVGRHEATGAVQRIPGHAKKVEMIIKDGLTISSWPKFLHPYPLSDKYFLVAAKPNPPVGMGYLPGRHLRQHAAHQGTAGPRRPRADSVSPDAPAADHPQQDQSCPPGRHGLRARYLRRQRAQGSAPRHGQEPADLHLPFRLSGNGRPFGRGRHGRALGYQTRGGYGAGQLRRIDQIPHPGQPAGFAATLGRRRQSPATDAKVG